MTKSAQICLTNDPKQRPVFSVFDSIYSLIYYTGLTMFVTSFLLPKYNILDGSGAIQTTAFYNPDFYVNLWTICAAVSAALAIVGLWRKDRSEFYGTGEAQRLRLRDYWETVKNNRLIRMLIVSACSDKLTLTVQSNSVVMIMLFGSVIGNYGKYSSFAGITGILTLVVGIFLIRFVATRMGQKKALIVGTRAGIICAAGMFALLFFGDPGTVNFAPINLYTAAFLGLYVLMRGIGSLSGSIVIPMTADCTDYEVYRSGKYVHGLMGTLFSFIDKLISSLAATIIGLLPAVIGFRSQQPPRLRPTAAVFSG